MSLKSQVENILSSYKKNQNEEFSQKKPKKSAKNYIPLQTSLKINSKNPGAKDENISENLENLIRKAEQTTPEQNRFQHSYSPQKLKTSSPTKYIKQNNLSVHERLYKEGSIKKAHSNSQENNYKQYIQHSASKQKIQDSSAILLTQQLEEKLQTTLNSVDSENVGKVNFYQIGQLLTNLNVFRVNHYSGNISSPFQTLSITPLHSQDNTPSPSTTFNLPQQQSQQQFQYQQQQQQQMPSSISFNQLQQQQQQNMQLYQQQQQLQQQSQQQQQQLNQSFYTQLTYQTSDLQTNSTTQKAKSARSLTYDRHAKKSQQNLQVRQHKDNELHLQLWQILTGFAPQQTEFVPNSLVYEIFWALYHPLQYTPNELSDIIWKYLQQAYQYLSFSNFQELFDEQQFLEYKNIIKSFTQSFKTLVFDNLAFQEIRQIKLKKCEQFLQENQERFQFTPKINSKSCEIDRKSSQKLLKSDQKSQISDFQSPLKSQIDQIVHTQPNQQSPLTVVYESPLKTTSSRFYIEYPQNQQKQGEGGEELQQPQEIIIQNNNNSNSNKSSLQHQQSFCQPQQSQQSISQQSQIYSEHNSNNNKYKYKGSSISPIKHQTDKALYNQYQAQNMTNSLIYNSNSQKKMNKSNNQSQISTSMLNQSTILGHNQILTKSENILLPQNHFNQILQSQRKQNPASFRALEFTGRDPSQSPLQRLELMNKRSYKQQENLQNLKMQSEKKYHEQHPFQPDISLNKTINEVALKSFYNGETDIVKRLYKFKSKEEQRQQEAFYKTMKMQQELSQCTFKPQTNINSNPNNSKSSNNSSNNTSSSKKQDKLSQSAKEFISGFLNSVERMRISHMKTQEKKQIMEHIPSGEKYEFYKNMKPNPPSFLSRKKSNSISHKKQNECKKPFYYIDIKLENNKVGTIGLCEDDVPGELAQKFCDKHKLDSEQKKQIKSILSQQLITHKKNTIQLAQKQQYNKQKQHKNQQQYSQNMQQHTNRSTLQIVEENNFQQEEEESLSQQQLQQYQDSENDQECERERERANRNIQNQFQQRIFSEQDFKEKQNSARLFSQQDFRNESNSFLTPCKQQPSGQKCVSFSTQDFMNLESTNQTNTQNFQQYPETLAQKVATQSILGEF